MTVVAAGRRILEAPLALGDDGVWRLDLDVLERAFADAAVYLLCNPHNPTGLVHTREELAAIAELATRHGVIVLSDEIHAPLALDGATHVPYPTVGEEAAAHGLTLASASKAWNIAGLKAAVVVAAGGGAVLLGKAAAGGPVPRGSPRVLASSRRSSGRAWRRAARHLDLNCRRLACCSSASCRPSATRARGRLLAWLDCRESARHDPTAFLGSTAVALSRPGSAPAARASRD
jgi:cystathionine beta-lyase